MDIDFQTVFNLLLTIVLGAVAFITTRVFRSLDRLEEQDRMLTREVHAVKVGLPTNYMTKADINGMMDRVMKKLDSIEGKLNSKTDK